MPLSDNQNKFLSWVRNGIGHQYLVDSVDFDWNAIETIAKKQGLLAVVFDGVENAPESHRPPQVMWLRWIGEVAQEFEQRYALYRKAVGDLAVWYHAHGYRMMVLKGLACGMDWPKPEHRPYGDIDIWLIGRQKEADAEMVSSFKIKDPSFKIDNSHHHHTVFQWHGFTVENHYDFGNVHHHRSSVEIEKVFKELGTDDSYYIDVDGGRVYLPSPNLHALYLLRHSMTDFAAFNVTLRQVLDWGFYVKKYHKEIDWGWLIKVLEEYHMKEFFDTINTICVEDLGFDASLFPYIQCNQLLKDKVLSDILAPRFSRESPNKLFPRLVFKYRRWKGNSWKHKLCYNESMGSAFWSGVKNHLMKPSSI
jgi:hypothetical protein